MTRLTIPTVALALIALTIQAQDAPAPKDPPSIVASATAEGKYSSGTGEEVEISTYFGEATWGQIFAKLAGDNKITWTQSETNDAGVTAVQAGFTPAGAPADIRVTMFLLSGTGGVRFERMKFARGDESREKAGLDAIESLAEGYREGPPSRAAAIGVLNKNHARQLILGCLIYASENEGAFPPNVDALLASEAIEEKLLWRHPETDEKSDFLYYGAGKTEKTPGNTVIFAAPVSIGAKRTIAQADGAVIDLPEAEFQKAIAPKKE